MNKNLPIGVFDSGIGGLTVVREIIEALPQENIIYFGDLARLPYGTKSENSIRQFTSQTVQFLLNKNVKAIVIACNTISAVAKDTVIQLADNIPVIDVISAGSLRCDKKARVGIIATTATINSDAYPKAIHNISPNTEVISQACPLFVPLIEEGYIEHEALELIANDYLQPLKAQQINQLILGCTHYPLIHHTISKIMGESITLIDPALTTCHILRDVLSKNSLLNTSKKSPQYHFYVTDIPIKFKEIGERFLNRPLTSLELVTLN